MATRLEDEFDPTRINAPDAAYPAGSLKDETTPGVSDDGTPLASRVGNDWQGFSQSALDKAGIAANGQPDSVSNPQILQAIEQMYNDGDSQLAGGNIWPLSSQESAQVGDDLTGYNFVRLQGGDFASTYLFELVALDGSGVQPNGSLDSTNLTTKPYTCVINGVSFLLGDSSKDRNHASFSWASNSNTPTENTDCLNAGIGITAEGRKLKCTNLELDVDGEVNLNLVSVKGKILDLDGGRINMTDDAGTIILGRPLSGLLNGELTAYTGFAGEVVQVRSATRLQQLSFEVRNLNIRQFGFTGVALALKSRTSYDSGILSWGVFDNINFDRFQYALRMTATDDASSGASSFISANTFSNLIFGGQSLRHLDMTSFSGGGAIGGNNFNNLLFQWHANTEIHIFGNQFVSNNNFSNVFSWDTIGKPDIYFELQGETNMLTGFIPEGVSDFAPSTITFIRSDLGAAAGAIQLGEYKQDSIRNTQQSFGFSSGNLPVINVAQTGSFLKELVGAGGGSLTSLNGATDGMRVNIFFQNGNTTVAHLGAGSGGINLISGANRQPSAGEMMELVYNEPTTTWYEVGPR